MSAVTFVAHINITCAFRFRLQSPHAGDGRPTTSIGQHEYSCAREQLAHKRAPAHTRTQTSTHSSHETRKSRETERTKCAELDAIESQTESTTNAHTNVLYLKALLLLLLFRVFFYFIFCVPRSLDGSLILSSFILCSVLHRYSIRRDAHSLHFVQNRHGQKKKKKKRTIKNMKKRSKIKKEKLFALCVCYAHTHTRSHTLFVSAQPHVVRWIFFVFYYKIDSIARARSPPSIYTTLALSLSLSHSLSPPFV